MAKRVKSSELRSEDRLSELPEHLRTYILSKLPTEESIKLSILSKTWRDLWLTMPFLCFDKKFYLQIFAKGAGDTSYVVDSWFNFIDRVLEQRCQRLLNKGLWTELRLSIPDTPGFYSCFRADTCLHYAFTNFQMTRLVVDYSEGFYVKGRSYSIRKGILQLGPYLRELTLNQVSLDHQTISNLATSFPLMESLLFGACTLSGEVIRISGLRKLVRVNVSAYFTGTKRVEIDALPSVRQCTLYCLRRSGKNFLEIEVGATCRRLKYLGMTSVKLTEHFLKGLQSHLVSLRKLRVDGCSCPERLTISSSSIKSLDLFPCNGLDKLHINAPKLQKFKYYCSLKVGAPAAFSWHAFYPLKTEVNIGYPVQLDVKLVEFLRQLNRCSRNILGYISIWTDQNIDLTDIREKCAPIYGISSFTLHFGVSQPDTEWLLEANHIEQVLCLFPNLKQLVISWSCLQEHVVLQFKYKKENGEGSDNSWQRCMEEVTISTRNGYGLNFSPLRNLFEDARGADKIIVHQC